jgi:hypothetical protein
MLVEIGANWEALPDQKERASSLSLSWLSIETANGKLNDCLDLLTIEPVVPLHEVVDTGARFKVFKDGRYRHPCAFQDPCAADFARDTLRQSTVTNLESPYQVAYVPSLFLTTMRSQMIIGGVNR